MCEQTFCVRVFLCVFVFFFFSDNLPLAGYFVTNFVGNSRFNDMKLKTNDNQSFDVEEDDIIYYFN